MKLEDIGFYTLSEERARTASETSPIMRLEIIVTDQCNFRCPYCRGLRPDCQGSLGLEDYRSIIDKVSGGNENLRNLRLSGGEPTAWKPLVEAVRYAKEKCAHLEHIAISTNGSANRTMYDALLEAGVNDFSVSLDACCASDGALMSGRNEKMWNHVVDNIRYLSSKTYTTVGIVVTEINVGNIAGVIDLATGLGVSDVRVIPATQYGIYSNHLSNITAGHHYPILDYRCQNIALGRPVRGLQEYDTHCCGLALDDLAVAGGHHYPCIIYLRERGEPIGNMQGSITEIRRKRAIWAREHDCFTDPICQKNCLDVCVDYNNAHACYRENQDYQESML